MKQARTFALALTLAFGAAALVSTTLDARGQDGDAPPPPPPPPGSSAAKDAPAPAPAAETEAEAAARLAAEEAERKADAEARAYLNAAADRQGGKGLVPPGGSLESFRILCRKVTFEMEKKNDEGGVTRTTIETDDDGLEVLWKKDQVKTVWVLDGKRTQRGRFRRGDVLTPWLHDGEKTTLLAGEQYRADLDQVERDGRIVRALLDVGILRTMLADGSRWRIVAADTFEGVAIERTPPAGKDVTLKLTLWIDPKTFRVNGAKLDPNDADEATMFYSLGYDPEFPVVSGDELSFPFAFDVYEQMSTDPSPRKVMSGVVSSVWFNKLADADMTPPKAR